MTLALQDAQASDGTVFIASDLQALHDRASGHAAGCALQVPCQLAQPLAGSWQDRVKAAKKAEKRAAKKAAKAAADNVVRTSRRSARASRPAGRPCSTPDSGDVYYGNLSTKVGAVCTGAEGGVSPPIWAAVSWLCKQRPDCFR